MRDQVWYVAALIALMCLVRLGLAAVAYVEPVWLLEELGAPSATNQQAPYVVRVWAIRDIVLAVLVLAARDSTIRPLLLACIVIDATDIMSAQLSGAAGLFNAAQTLSLTMTAVAALVPEAIALALIVRTKGWARVRPSVAADGLAAPSARQARD
jgi:hypothetical protein